MLIKLFALTFGLALLCPAASFGEPRSVPKITFFETTPFASLGWVYNSPTRERAKSDRKVWDLSDGICTELPSQPSYWFVLNHRNPANVGAVGYFAIRIIYESESNEAVMPRALHLFRNANWYRSDGTQEKKDFERRPDSHELDVDSFAKLHEEGDANAARVKLESFVGAWHMMPEATGPSSWDERSFYGRPIRLSLTREVVSGVSARLVRFTATDATTSPEPVLFWLSSENATAATILVDTPNISSEGARSAYRVVFGGRC